MINSHIIEAIRCDSIIGRDAVNLALGGDNIKQLKKDNLK